MDWEATWYMICNAFGGVTGGFERALTAVFGSANSRYIEGLQPRLKAINGLEEKYKKFTDDELRAETARFRARLKKGEALDDLLVEAFAVCREGGRRFLGMRHYDVQMIGGMVLHSGAIAEMITGEGKTLVATLPAYLNALDGKGVHVVTVNDYLARRDMEWMGPLYLGLGVTVGAIQSDMAVLERQKAYDCDITYGTNNEFGFDYLRDNMRSAARGDNRYPKPYQQSQGRLTYAIIDEVDNILIDEARTPLIISGPAFEDVKKYAEADRIARQLRKEEHFTVNEKDHTVVLTEAGIRAAEKMAGVETFYSAGNMEWPHLIDNALKAHHLYQRDVRYVVEDGAVIIVDEFTGRKMEGRQWSDGLHQAVEAKEGVKVKEETQTLATITLQNFFKLYKKICGMTGTAMTEAGELLKIYNLDVIAIPPNRNLQRIEKNDLIFCTEEEKFEAVADEIEKTIRWDVLYKHDGTEAWGAIVEDGEKEITFRARDSKENSAVAKSDVAEVQKKGRPVLVGTTSIEKSERLSALLERRGIKHAVLNAKHHKREAEIVAQAGRLGAVTIATNMAGRGTDIVLGGNPETMAWARLQSSYATRLDVPKEVWTGLVHEIEQAENMKAEGEVVRKLGGLKVVGTERHEARRIDLQLRGRCGRQGDPGSSQFFLSLEDDLVRIIIGGEWVKGMMQFLGMQRGEYIENSMVTSRIEFAQQKMEERNFDVRKNLLEYDEVMDEQRKRVYRFRQSILEGASAKSHILEMIRKQVEKQLKTYLNPDYGVDTFAAWASTKLSMTFDPSSFRGESFETVDRLCKDDAERMVESQVLEAIDETLPGGADDEEDTNDWNWNALAAMASRRWGVQVKDRELIKIGRNDVAEFLITKAHEAIRKTDLTEGRVYCEPNYGVNSAIAWAKVKFGIDIALDEVKGADPEVFKELVYKRAVQAYEARETEYPVLAGLYRFSVGTGPNVRLEREPLVEWARSRFETEVSLDDIKSKQRDEIRALLVDRSRAFQQSARKAAAQLEEKLDSLLGDRRGETTGIVDEEPARNNALVAFTAWLQERIPGEWKVEELGDLTPEDLEQRVLAAAEDRYRPEIRRMEREVLLHIVDSAWKEHLLAMDYLRSAVAFRGFAQVDPKIEYKREGMRLFDDMWYSIGERVTDLIYKVEQLDEDFVSSTSTWQGQSARHDDVGTLSDQAEAVEREQQQVSGEGPPPDQRIEPIRNRGEVVGRNDPCPCGSGKKYKNCHMRQKGLQI